MNPPSHEAPARQGLVLAIAAVILLVGALQLTRPGYSVDEEFTVFAVRGIQAQGLPILPSGLLYDRGIAYSYSAWLAGAVTGAELPAFRAVSLISAALSVLITFFLIRRIAGNATAAIASLLMTASVPFWATATTARFYAPFLGSYLLALYFLTHRHWWIGLIAAAALARLTHELAFTLAVIPVVCWLLDRNDRRRWSIAAGAVIGGLVFGQAILFGLHASVPSSGETMVRRFFLWQVINLFERPGDRQFTIPLVVAAIALIASPKRAWTISVIALSLAGAILAFSIAQASNSGPWSGELVKSVLIEGSRYPLDMFWHIARAMPLTLLMTCAGLIARGIRVAGEWRPGERAIHALWIGWVLWFGVIESGITTNYLLLPVTFMLIAIAMDGVVLIRLPRVPAFAIIFLIIAFDQWGRSPVARLEAARPTILAEGIGDIKAGLQPSDRVACTDELGCLMLVGRIDRWLALDDYVRERFLVRRGDGPASGVYTGLPAVFRPMELFAPNVDGSLPDRVLIVDIFKDYPIGNSRFWLPKAIEEDGLQVTPLLETPQMRVLQVSPREQIAGLR
ncbi:MAG TPA: glycosyltransferase family 39 protein [Vicinamibacterales bacterium]|nr:glycosyltransferase family 39 protein [Vicinamibacterales bacterium]